MKKILAAIVLSLAFLFSAAPSSAQAKCEGPAELCAQVVELRQKLDTVRADDANKSDADTSEKAAKAVAVAGFLAIALKTLLSVMSGYVGYFTSDKSKAWVRVTTIGVGLVAFFLTNVGLGMPWWQALIIAGGGPGSIALHELMKLIPVILGKAKLPPTDPPVSGGAPQPV